MNKQVFNFNGKELAVTYDVTKKIVNIGNLTFTNITDFTYFVNKLTDICEDIIRG